MFRYICVVVEVNPAAKLLTLSDGTWRFTAQAFPESQAGDLWLCQGRTAPGRYGTAPSLVKRIQPPEAS